jgi:hypothetical protein
MCNRFSLTRVRRRRVAEISRLDDLGLHFWVADGGTRAAVPGLAS